MCRDHESTLNFALENPTEMANFYSAMAYPGSPLYAQARRDGTELPKNYLDIANILMKL